MTVRGPRRFPSCSNKLFASWCNGSTADSGSVCHGSNPCEAAILGGRSLDPEFLREQLFEPLHGCGELMVQRCQLRGGQGIRTSLGKRAVWIGLRKPADERIHPYDKRAGLTDCFQRHILRRFARRDPDDQPAVELPAPCRAPPIDCAAAAVVGGAGLMKIDITRAALDLQARRRKGARGIRRLKQDRVEQHSIAAHPACRTKPLGSGAGFKTHEHSA